MSDTLLGKVVDASGAAVAGATVLIRNASGAAQKPARTDANGAFTISGLSAGNYRLVVSNPGFETKELPVTVGAEAPAPLRISLVVSGVSSTVLVTATRSEEQADKQPASTSVVDIQDIQNRNVQTLDESLDMVPGLYTQRDKGPADAMPSTVLRGFTGANRTLVLLDGQPIDASIVFAVGLMVALIQAFSLAQLLDPNSHFTIMTKDARTGQVELIEKDHRAIKVKKMTPEKKGGPGVRLGVAYQLPDGSVVYVPENADAAKPSPAR